MPTNASLDFPPSWAGELCDAVLRPDSRSAAPEWVSILPATRELQGWLADPRPYEGIHRQGWLSALEDFQASLGQLGPDLRHALGGDLTAADHAAASLKSDIAPPATQAAVTTRLQARQAADHQVLSRLSARWGTPAIREAAWNDLVEACRDPVTSRETLATRRDLFWQLMRVGDYATDLMSQLLAGILADSTFSVTLARIWLGDITEAEATWPQRHPSGLLQDQDAGLTQDEQLASCRRLITTPPVQRHHVVWVAFDHAGPGSNRQEVGRVSFWDCEWVREVLRCGHAGPNLDSIPGELKAGEGFFRPESLPEDRDVRLARVNLGMGAWTDPVRVATEQAEAVVALAGFHVGDARWRHLPGYLAAVDGRVTGIQAFGRVPGVQDIPTGLYQDSMDTELARLEPQMQGRLPITDRDLSEIVHAVRWWQQARRQPPLAAILLHVRVLELLSQRLRVAKWYNYLDDYHRAFWTRRAMLDCLGSLIDDCVLNYDHVAPGDQERVKELGRSMTAYQPGGRRTVDLSQALNALPELARLFPPHDRLGRRARSALARFTLPALVTWRDGLVSDWNLARDRLIRVRNSLAHGGPIEDEPADSVHAFARQLAGWSLAVALEGLLQGQGIEQAHSTRQQHADQWNDALATAPSVAAALIDPPL